MSHAPLFLSLPLAALLLILALPLGIAGVRGWTGRLDRLGRFGIHTPAAQASDRAFALANKVGAPLMMAAAAVGAVCAVLVVTLPVGVVGAIVIAVIGVAGLFAQMLAATNLGERSARTVPLPARKPAGGGCCGGCGCGSGGCGSANESAETVVPAAPRDARLGAVTDIRDFV